MNSTEQNSQTQAPKKEMPDWFKVIIVPLFLAVVAGFITYINNQAQANIADEKRQDDVLSKYIEDMKGLLVVDKSPGLLEPEPKEKDVRRTIARALTMTAFSQLTSQGGWVPWPLENLQSQDGWVPWPLENLQSRNLRSLRRKWVLRFLSESRLIDKENTIVRLEGADLHEANLEQIILEGVNLKGVRLEGANLSGATLSNVDLSEAKKLTREQLEGENPPLLCNVILPKGFPNKFGDRDCEKISNISAVPASPASSSYPDLEEWLASKSWEEANRYTFNLIRDAHPSGEGVTKAAIDQFPCQSLKDIDQLWVHYSNGAFGFSIQKKILESAGHQLVALDRQNAINAYHRLAQQVGWKNSNVWKNVPDFRLEVPRGKLPRIEFTVDKQGQPNNTLVPFDILLRADTCQL